jgi:hypothetical protein
MEMPVLLVFLSSIVLAVAPLWFLYRARTLGSRSVATIFFWIALTLLSFAALYLTITSHLPGIFLFFIAVLYPVLRTAFQEASAKNLRPLPLVAEHNSRFRTEWLELSLAQDTRKFVGNVLRGQMRNWRLHEMDGHDLRQLRHEFLSHDIMATLLLDLWLDKEGPVHWRRDFSTEMLTTPTPTLSLRDKAHAAEILGVPVDASPEIVQAAQARLEDLIGKGSEHSSLLTLIAASADILIRGRA